MSSSFLVSGNRQASTADVLWRLLVPAALLLVAVGLILGNSGASSSTFDEPYHLGAGYAYLRTGDPRLFSDHPPLIDTWLATPLLLMDLELPLGSVAWQNGEYGSFGDVFLWQANPDQAVKSVWMARLPNAAIALVLGAAVFAWTRSLAGLPAALLALAVSTLDSGTTANAALATNDLGVAAAIFLACWAWWRWLERPAPGRLIIAGALAGAACASKYSGLAVAPAFLLVALVHRPAGHPPHHVWRSRALGLLGAGGIALLVIWAVYGFAVEGGVPAPQFWQGLLFQAERLVDGQPVYALGKIWPEGVWFYYPLALVLKTPLPLMVLTLMGVATGIVMRVSRKVLVLALPLLVVLAAALASALQLGYRYLLPALPFGFALAGLVLARSAQSGEAGRRPVRLAASGILLLWLAANAVAIHPQELAFFNELAGGPENADQYLVDANLDWGQGLLHLNAAAREMGVPTVHLGYFGSAVPDLYGISYWAAPGFLRFVDDPESMAFNPYSPDQGWYAISRTSLRQGLALTDPDVYRLFADRPPDGRAGHSINLYEVDYPDGTPVVRAVVEGERVSSLQAAQLGWHTGERLFAKWVANADSFVVAMGGPALYRVPDPLPAVPELREALASAAVSVEGGAWTADAGQAVAEVVTSWQETSWLYAPETGDELAPPVAFGGRLELIAHQLSGDSVPPGGTVDLTILWRVSGEPRPPVAMFVHLLSPGGEVLAQYDGWGAAMRGLEVGDIVVHHVALPIPADTAPGLYRPQVGLYAPDTMVRWVAQTPVGELDRVWLPEVEIR